MDTAAAAPSTRAFKKKFGSDLVEQIPKGPGVYFFYDASNELIYVGKAKNLRRRLDQYRNARRCRKHRKMRSIVKDACRLSYQTCPSELEACLLELRIIQENRPRWNVAGAFSFLYPMVGLRWKDVGVVSLCYTTEPEHAGSFDFHGAYRSRQLTGDAFFALIRLLGYVGHPNRKQGRPSRYSRLFEFRRIPEDWQLLLARFFNGESKELLESLSLTLLENAGARRDSTEVQADLRLLLRFWRHEVQPLWRARRKSGSLEYPVSQKERDNLFLKARYGATVAAGKEATAP